MSIEEVSRSQRVRAPRHHIDPGFINHRQILSVMGSKFRDVFEANRSKGDDHVSRQVDNHRLVGLLLDVLNNSGVPTLGEVLHNPQEGMLFCSTEQISPNQEIFDVERTQSSIILPYESEWDVNLEYSTQNIVADTGRIELHQGARVTVAAGIRCIEGSSIQAYPLIMGAPSFDHPENEGFGIDLMWYGWEWYEIFPADIDEFSALGKLADPTVDEWLKVMKEVPEEAVKEAICDILKEPTKKDWGGELNDHFTSALHLSGERVSGAFLLKGPADFREMTPRHLGKNADQIYRLACAPADVLIVQHCHTIGEAVRATLRAFAVNPAKPRRYCFLDGKDTYKLLKAYDKLPKSN